MNKEKGFSAIILVFLVLVILGIGVYLYMNKSSGDEMMVKDEDSMMILEEEEGDHGDFGAMEGYEEMEEPEGTPEEIDNSALEDLDALMMEIDSTTTGEELSDL